MIKQLDIHNFRCFQSLTLDNLAPITILGGHNNSGKSAILEAIVLAIGYRNPNVFISLAAGRNGNGTLQVTPERIWNPLFYDFDQTDELSFLLKNQDDVTSELHIEKVADDSASLDINSRTVSDILKQGYDSSQLNRHFFALHCVNKVGAEEEVGKFSFENTRIRYTPLNKLAKSLRPFAKVVFYKNLYSAENATTAELVSKFLLDGHKNLLLSILQSFDARIAEITTLIDSNIPYVYVILSDKVKMPITYMGDGINKVLQLLLLVLTTPNGIVLIDELENGFHYSVYPKVLQTLYKAALEVKCQLFFTTHSIDILRQSAKVLQNMNMLDKLCYERLNVSTKGRKAFHFSGEELDSALEAEMEVR